MIPVGTRVEIDGFEFLMEKKIQGSNMGSNRFRIDLPRLVDFYLSGKLKLDEMVSREIQLEQVNDAFDTLRQGEVARQVIRLG
jgi:S-(hydroxymethyl)glutathione dehydrogenase/alcohol dehydrogenase